MLWLRMSKTQYMRKEKACQFFTWIIRTNVHVDFVQNDDKKKLKRMNDIREKSVAGFYNALAERLLGITSKSAIGICPTITRE